jgi:hypothetical protein
LTLAVIGKIGGSGFARRVGTLAIHILKTCGGWRCESRRQSRRVTGHSRGISTLAPIKAAAMSPMDFPTIGSLSVKTSSAAR